MTFLEFRPGEAAQQPVNAASPSPEAAARARFGRVLLPDGTTPAAGAQVHLFRRGTGPGIALTPAGTDGRFAYRLDQLPDPAFRKKSDDPATRPFAVARLAGNYAPTVVELPVSPDETDEWRIVLAPAYRAQGRVTLGGRPIANLGNRVQVLFAVDVESQDWVDLETRPQFRPSADGTFDVGGLAAGTYHVQAALDGIWLSATHDVTVGPDVAAKTPLVLDVGAPGPPSVLTCVDRSGKPVAGATISLRRPPGPMAQRLWPRTFTADAAGVVHLPPLEVGTHTFSSAKSTLPYEMKIAPLAEAGKQPHRQTVRLD